MQALTGLAVVIRNPRDDSRTCGKSLGTSERIVRVSRSHKEASC